MPFDKPVERTRDVIEVWRKAWTREPLTHDGEAVTLPLPLEQGTGLGKPLKFMNHPLRSDLPIYVASLGPKNVEMTAELADGWQPLFTVPEKIGDVWGDVLDAGKARRPADLGELEIIAGGVVAIGSGPEVERARESARANAGFYVGGMGARNRNFYNDLFKRYGWEKEAEEIQDLFLSGHRDEAMSKVPDAYLDQATLAGDEGFVRERIGVYKESGVTILQVDPAGTDPLSIIETVKALAE